MEYKQRKAHENSLKIENALRAVKERNNGDGLNQDPTIWINEKGESFKTTERVVKDVPLPSLVIPSDEELFSNENSLPNYKFLRDHFRGEGKLSINQIVKILRMAIEILSKEPNLLSVPAPICVVGDIHGQFYDLCKLFEICGDPDKTSFLFLGDYVDRGDYSIECLLLLYTMKINHPETFFLLRGNHESKYMTSYFSFKNECLHKYTSLVYKESLKSFGSLPLCAIMNEQFFCCHGGISPKLNDVDDINKINRFSENFPSSGLFSDLLWADPHPDYDDQEIKGTTDNDLLYEENVDRNCSYYFSYEAASNFLAKNNLLSIIRAHQAQQSGFRMYKNTLTNGFPSLITLFSAPNYCGSYGNKAAALIYDGNVFNIRQFEASPSPFHLPKFMSVFPWSIPFVAEKTLEILLAVLNICTEDELGEETPVAREVAKSLDEVPDKAESAAATEPVPTLSPFEARQALRRKILSIGRMSRMFNILREESEKVEQLKSLAGGILPRGVLVSGPDAINDEINSFEKARLADLKNEGLPPTEEEIEKRKQEREKEIIEYVNQEPESSN